MHPENELIEARQRRLELIVDHFRADADVLGVFLAGSLANGTADEWADIDLRVVTTPAAHASFVRTRCDLPATWPGFLFCVPGTDHCVAHFAPFGKVDVFYYDAERLLPSPWYRLPITILHDPSGLIASVVRRSADLPFVVATSEVELSIGKAIAAAHEVYRRARRGELFYAQALLDDLRLRIMQADDWLADRAPETFVLARFETRAGAPLCSSLRRSYCPCESGAILEALRELLALYRPQLVALHDKFDLIRPLANDRAALDLLG